MNILTFNNNDFCNYKTHNQQGSELDARLPSFLNRSSGIFTGLRVTTGPGMSLNISTGKALVNGALVSKNRSTLSALNTNFNFILVTSVGTVSRVTGVSNFPSSGFFAVLGIAHASGGAFIALRDLRNRIGDPWLLAPGQATAFQVKSGSDGVFAYDVGIFFPGKPGASQVMMVKRFAREVSFPTSMSLSRAGSQTAAAATITIKLERNGTNFGRVIFGSGATIGSFAGTGVSFAAGGRLRVINAATADANLASISITLAGRKVL